MLLYGVNLVAQRSTYIPNRNVELSQLGMTLCHGCMFLEYHMLCLSCIPIYNQVELLLIITSSRHFICLLFIIKTVHIITCKIAMLFTHVKMANSRLASFYFPKCSHTVARMCDNH